MCNVLLFGFDVGTDTGPAMMGRGKQRAARFKCTASFEVSVWALLEESQS